MSQPPPVFEARALSKRFGRFTALEGVSLGIQPGEVLALFGRNGAGKTTFLHITATLLRPTSGELLYQGRPAGEASGGLRRRIGLLAHASFLYQDLTARENLYFFARLYGLSEKQAAVEQALEKARLSERADAPVRDLSRGMQQRLAIARAVLHQPRLLLLDEPYTGLDPVSAERLSRMIEEFRGPTTACILTTHDLERGREAADRVAILEAGRLVYQGGRPEPGELRRLLVEATETSR